MTATQYPKRAPVGSPAQARSRVSAAIPFRISFATGAVATGMLYLATHLALVWRFPPYWDESSYSEWVDAVVHDPSNRFVSMREQKEPLVSWLGALVSQLGFGNLTALRMVSVLAGLLSLLMIGLVARRFSDNIALLAMALFALMPFFVVHTSLGLFEPTVTAAALCALYLTIRIAERPRLDLAMLLGFALGAGVLTKQSGRITVALVPVGLLLFPWQAPDRIRRGAQWLGCAAVALLVCGLCFSVLMLSPFWPLYKKPTPIAHSFSQGVSHPFHWISASFPIAGKALLGYFGPVLIAAALAGLWWGLRDPRRRALMAVVGLWAVVPFVGALIFTANGYTRYYLPSVAPMSILCAVGLCEAGVRLRRRAGPAAVAFAAVIAVALPMILLVNVLAHPGRARYPGVDDTIFITSQEAGTAWKSVAHYLDQRTGGAPVKVVVSHGKPLALFLKDPKRVTETFPGSPDTVDAKFYIDNYSTPMTASERKVFRLVRRFTRPRDGHPIEVYEHIP